LAQTLVFNKVKKYIYIIITNIFKSFPATIPKRIRLYIFYLFFDTGLRRGVTIGQASQAITWGIAFEGGPRGLIIQTIRNVNIKTQQHLD